MVKIPHQPPVGPVTVNARQRSQQVEPTVAVNKNNLPVKDREKPFMERRKRKDRRDQKASGRGRFDLRSGRDRRKNSRGGRHIDVDA